MLTMDRPQFIDGAIRSVVAQSHSEWELIVVQDGPDPRIEPLVRDWEARDSRVRFFHRSEPGNIANAMNFAIRQSHGEFIAVLDDDDAWIEPEKLKCQLAMLCADPALLAVGGGALVVDAAGLERLRYSRATDPSACVRRALLANPLIHSTVLYRRSAWTEVGGYEESLPGYQDWDLFLKMMRVGKVTNVPQALATYRVWDGGGSSRKVLGNAWSSLRITWSHRRHFPQATVAVLASMAYVLFALLPGAFRRRLYQILSRVKKRIFSPEAPSS